MSVIVKSVSENHTSSVINHLLQYIVILFGTRRGLHHLNNQVKKDERNKKYIQDINQIRDKTACETQDYSECKH